MELEEAVRGRRSIRKFISKNIPRMFVDEILDTALWSPSWGNTQPWEFYVLTGEHLAAFKKAGTQVLADGLAFKPDIVMPDDWPSALKGRYNELGKNLLDILGIKREDKDARNQLHARMASLFDAPCLIVACIPRDVLAEYAMLDMGLVVQTICLLAHAKGLGTCIMAAAVRYPDLLRKIASIPDDRRIVMGIALGFPDPNYPLNRFERKRAKPREIVHWLNDCEIAEAGLHLDSVKGLKNEKSKTGWYWADRVGSGLWRDPYHSTDPRGGC
jgi:nitroreductase